MLQNVGKAEVLVTTLVDNNKPKLVPDFRIQGCLAASKKEIAKFTTAKGRRWHKFLRKRLAKHPPCYYEMTCLALLSSPDSTDGDGFCDCNGSITLNPSICTFFFIFFFSF